jgi:hypothetical protein
MLKQSWADLWLEATWRWPRPTAIMAWSAQAVDATGCAPAMVTTRARLTAARAAAARHRLYQPLDGGASSRGSRGCAWQGGRRRSLPEWRLDVGVVKPGGATTFLNGSGAPAVP